jgi:ankyrin repeat protein
MKLWLAAVALSALAASAACADDLIDAARSGDRARALALLDADADPDAAEADGATALHYAAHKGDAELVSRLLAAGADPAVESDFGSTPMREAAETGNAEVIRLLLAAGADVESRTPEGQTALMAVARAGRLDAARLLIEAGADVNAQEAWGGQTALMWAAAQHQSDMLRLLIEAGADPNMQATPRDWERRVTSEPRIKEMFSGGLTALIYAAREGCLECARVLVEEGQADIDQADPDGVTPLIAALLNMRYDTAAYLIEAGADVDKWDWWGRTPLYAAVDMIRVPASRRVDMPATDEKLGIDIVALLLERGADPNLELKLTPPPRNIVYDRGADDQSLTTGASPLLRAAYGGEVEAARLLLDHGALPDTANKNGVTPLLAAASSGGTRGPLKTEAAVIETMRLLIAAGSDVDQQDRLGQTPLHRAARLGWNEVVRFLGASGADLEAKDRGGMTALDYAAGKQGTVGFGRFDPGVARPETVAVLEALAEERRVAQAGGG